jgi:hypothetical protein
MDINFEDNFDKPAPNEDLMVEILDRVAKLVEDNDGHNLALLIGMGMSGLSRAAHIHNPRDCSEGCKHMDDIIVEVSHALASGKTLKLLGEAEIISLASAAGFSLAVLAPDDSEVDTPQKVLEAAGRGFHKIEDDPDGWEVSRKMMRDRMEMELGMRVFLAELAGTEEPEIEF